MGTSELVDLNAACPALHSYQMGTELNKLVTDITGILADQVLNRLDVAEIIGSRNCVLDTAAGLAISTTDLKIKTTNDFHYTINGGMYKKAATAAITLAGTATLACAKSAYAAYLVTINATGAIALVKGADATSAAKAMAALATATVAEDLAPVGVIHVQNSAGAIFTPGAAGTGLGDFADDTTADTYVDFVGVDLASFANLAVQGDNAAYAQTFNTIT